MINTSLQEFASSGYLNVLVQGGQILAKTSVLGRKGCLIFMCKLLLFYDTFNCLNSVHLYLFRSISVVATSSINFFRPIWTL